MLYYSKYYTFARAGTSLNTYNRDVRAESTHQFI